MNRHMFLLCGLVSSLVYAGADVTAGLSWSGYDFSSQAVSELGAIGAPTRPLLLVLFTGYSLLLVGFGTTVSTSRLGPLALSGWLWAAVGFVSLVVAPFVPIHIRGAERTLSDTLHIAVTAVTVLLILVAIGSASNAFGRPFRLFSIATILVMLVFGAWAGAQARRLDAGLPTPYLGLAERISIYAFLLWVAVFSLLTFRAERAGTRLSAPGATQQGA